MHLLKYFKELSLHPENAQEIRALILELAIRGRLTEDWRREHPDVEPASVLLERIRHEKARLVKEKAIRKERRQPSIEEGELPYSIPPTWHWCRLGDYIRNFGQKKPDKEFTYIDVGSIDNNRGIISESTSDLSPEKAPSRARKIVKHGTVIYSTVRPYLLNIAIVSREFKYEPIASTAFAILHPLADCPPEYLYTILRSPYFIEYVESKMKGVAYPAINDKQMMASLVPTPPLPEQHAIVATVNRLLAEVDELEEQTTRFRALRQDYVTASLRQMTEDDSAGAWAALRPHFKAFFDQQNGVDRLREAILELAVQGKLTANWRAEHPEVEPASVLLERIREKKERLVRETVIKKDRPLTVILKKELPFEIPYEWEWTRLGEICPNISSGSTPPKSEFKDQGVPYLKVYNIRNQKINFSYKEQYVSPDFHSSKLKRSILRPGDVIMNIVGPPLGKTAIIPDSYSEWNCNQAITFFKPLKREMNRWIHIYIQSKIFLRKMELIGTAGQDNISVTKSKNIVLPVPPFFEQRAIINIVDDLMALCDQLQERIQKRKLVEADFLRASVEELSMAAEKAEA